MSVAVVTGGSGRLGRTLCSRLEADFDVRVVDPRAEESDWDCRDAVRGADIVYHLVATRFGRDVLERNLSPLREVLGVADPAKTRVVLVSSSAAGWGRDPYADAKRQMEAMAQRWSPDVCVVRPPRLYGVPDPRRFDGLIGRAQRGEVMFLPGGGRSRFAPLFFDDLAEVLAALAGTPVPGIHDVPGPVTMTVREFLAEAALAAGHPLKQIAIPAPGELPGVAALAERLGRPDVHVLLGTSPPVPPLSPTIPTPAAGWTMPKEGLRQLADRW